MQMTYKCGCPGQSRRPTFDSAVSPEGDLDEGPVHQLALRPHLHWPERGRQHRGRPWNTSTKETQHST